MGKRSLLWVVGMAAVTLVFPACDTLVNGGETIFLQPKSVTFSFVFGSDDVTQNVQANIAGASTVDLGPLVAQDGYSKSDIVSVRVEQAEIRRRHPQAVNLSFLRNVQVLVQGGGVGQISIAGANTLPAESSANLQPVSGVDLASRVTGPSFSAVLRFEPMSVLPDEEYELEVTLRLRIEVEG